MIHLFISYRRADGTHAAQRVRACMQAKFGSDAVFIDRDIPPGTDWAQYLRLRLEACSDVIVLVGDAFMRELRHRGRAGEAQEMDWLKNEIETALQLGKTIYPVIIGRLEMPDKNVLPAEIRGFAACQAVFAREPAFDAAMGVLGKAIAARHGWVEPAPQPAASTPWGADGAGAVTQGVLLLVLALLLSGLAGHLIQWLASNQSGGTGSTGAFTAFTPLTCWLGAMYGLLTLLWGMGPYLVYRSVAEVRARAQLPVLNLLGMLTMLNVALALLAGGTFLLLSTQAGWVLHLRGVLPASPGYLDYAVQGLVLLLIVFAAVAAAMLEPVIRHWAPPARRQGMAGLLGAALVVLATTLWMAESVVRSVPMLGALDPVPVVGYFMLAPALSVLVLAWDLSRSALGLTGQAWHSRALFGLAISLYAACTLGYFAHGPVRLFVAQ